MTKDSESKGNKQLDQIVDKFGRPLMSGIAAAIPVIVTYSQIAWRKYKKLPADELQFLTGMVICFLGGVYPALFAAIEAAKHGGIKTVVKALGDLTEEAMVIIEKSKEDDDKDEDKDGVKDVNQISTKELIARKTQLVIRKINPEKVEEAIVAIYQVWLAVIAVLTLKFAKTIALAASIAKFFQTNINKLTSKVSIPKGYEKWVPILVRWFTMAIAMSFAWTLQSVVTAFASALTGALLMTRAMLSLANNKGWTFGNIVPKNHEDTNIDEYLSYVFAAMGLYFQFKISFDISFPFNILLLPAEIGEYCLRAAITNES